LAKFVAILVVNTLSVSLWCMAHVSTCRVLL